MALMDDSAGAARYGVGLAPTDRAAVSFDAAEHEVLRRLPGVDEIGSDGSDWQMALLEISPHTASPTAP